MGANWPKKSDYLKQKDGKQFSGFNHNVANKTLRDKVADSIKEWRYPPGYYNRAQTKIAQQYVASLVDHITAFIAKDILSKKDSSIKEESASISKNDLEETTT